MRCDVQRIIKVGGIVAIIMGAISLHAWDCPDCKEVHDDPFCSVTGKDKNGLTPSDYEFAGSLPDGIVVYGTPHGHRSPDGQAVHEVGTGYFLYKLPTSFGSFVYCDGVNNSAYNENGEEYSIVGSIADGNLVFLYTQAPKDLLFTISLNKCTTIFKTQDNRFVYGEPCYQVLSNSKDVYFDGFEYTDSEGNTYERNELKICKDTCD
jgi:hypothetical protein